MKTFVSKGIICVRSRFDLVYAVCKISYIYSSDDTFEYVFEPNYPIIELLDSSVFQGIPGLNLDLREKEYIRKNKTPTFISERVPSDNREDYAELLDKVKMDYMDPIEYLIRCKEQYSGDSLFVVPFYKKSKVIFDGQHSNLTNSAFFKSILVNICLGNDVVIGGQIINDDNRKCFHDVFLALYSRSRENMVNSQRKGIQQAKKSGVYKGRKPIPVDELLFCDMLSKVEKGEISPKVAAEKMGISIDKYYRFKKTLQK